MPQQGQSQPDNFTYENTGEFSETEASIQRIFGMSTAFGSRKTVKVVDGHGIEFSQQQSFIVGSGRRVSKLEDIGGVCKFCQMEAAPLYEAGNISLQQFELASLYDVHSSAQCDVCRGTGCNRHIKPVQLPNGQVMQLCVACQEQLNIQLKKERRRQCVKNIFGFFFSPFIEKDF